MTYQSVTVTTLCPSCDKPIEGTVRCEEGGERDEIGYDVDRAPHRCNVLDVQIDDALIDAAIREGAR